MHNFGNITVATGDVLLKHSTGHGMHNVIKIGQKVGAMSGGFSGIVHAAIYVGSVQGQTHAIAESVGSGLRLASPDPTSNYVWDVWHLGGNQELRRLAADLASNLVMKAQSNAGFGSYGTANAAKSVIKTSNVAKAPVSPTLSSDLMDDFTSQNGTHNSFFCSNFVVLAYAMASQMLGLPLTSSINLNYKYSSPAEMNKYFSRSLAWANIGNSANLY